MPPVSDAHIRPSGAGREGPAAPPVYPSRADTFLLVPFATVAPGTSFLEVGTGRGAVAIAAARRGARVVATDLNPHALRAVATQARAEGLPLELVRTDLAHGLGRFDRVVFNPPYLPTQPWERDPDRWHDLALDGGPDGTQVAGRWVDELEEHLSPGGAGFLVVSTRQAAGALEAIWARWRSLGATAEVVASRNLEGERLEVWRLTRSPTCG